MSAPPPGKIKNHALLITPHRYVIQERLKLLGAWWKAAGSMLALRVVRANNLWDDYWDAKAA